MNNTNLHTAGYAVICIMPNQFGRHDLVIQSGLPHTSKFLGDLDKKTISRLFAVWGKSGPIEWPRQGTVREIEVPSYN